MKLIFVVKYYDAYRISFYKKIATHNDLSYDQLNELFLDDCFSFYSSLIQILRRNGHEAELIIPNCNIIREKWQHKKGIKLPLNNYDFILSAVKYYQPDIIFLSSNFEYFGAFAQQLKLSCKAICAWISCPYDKNMDITMFDHIFTLFPPHYEEFKKLGIGTTLVTAGFDRNVFEKFKNKPLHPQIDFSFIGGIGSFHKRREYYLKKICKKTPLQLWGYGFSSDNPIKKSLKDIKNGFAYNRHYRGLAWGLEMFNVLYRSKITLNIHGDIANNHSVNMRLFEATGMGTLLLTDYSDNIDKLFIPDVEIVTFKSPEEAIEKYNYYIQHDEEREKIAKAGQQKTLSNYNYTDIAKIFMNEFEKLINP